MCHPSTFQAPPSKEAAKSCGNHSSSSHFRRRERGSLGQSTDPAQAIQTSGETRLKPQLSVSSCVALPLLTASRDLTAALELVVLTSYLLSSCVRVGSPLQFFPTQFPTWKKGFGDRGQPELGEQLLYCRAATTSLRRYGIPLKTSPSSAHG